MDCTANNSKNKHWCGMEWKSLERCVASGHYVHCVFCCCGLCFYTIREVVAYWPAPSLLDSDRDSSLIGSLMVALFHILDCSSFLWLLVLVLVGASPMASIKWDCEEYLVSGSVHLFYMLLFHKLSFSFMLIRLNMARLPSFQHSYSFCTLMPLILALQHCSFPSCQYVGCVFWCCCFCFHNLRQRVSHWPVASFPVHCHCLTEIPAWWPLCITIQTSPFFVGWCRCCLVHHPRLVYSGLVMRIFFSGVSICFMCCTSTMSQFPSSCLDSPWPHGPFFSFPILFTLWCRWSLLWSITHFCPVNM